MAESMLPHKLAVVLPLFLMCFMWVPIPAAGIDCFKCVSVNGSNPACEDPFHNNHSSNILERPCMGGRKGRNGLFPASACIKLSGTYSDGSGTIMVRGCALDSGTLTTDTELIRMSHCGSFYFEDKYVYGCVQSCDDTEACNTGGKTHETSISTLLILLLLQLKLFNWEET
eukprot:10044.XXX_483812_480587_1 [CDS] Oithona nana genome sequencing.